MDFIATFNGDMVICHNTNRPCAGDMCPHYKWRPAGYALCDEVENGFSLIPNSELIHPSPAPVFTKEWQKFVNPNKRIVEN